MTRSEKRKATENRRRELAEKFVGQAIEEHDRQKGRLARWKGMTEEQRKQEFFGGQPVVATLVEHLAGAVTEAIKASHTEKAFLLGVARIAETMLASRMATEGGAE